MKKISFFRKKKKLNDSWQHIYDEVNRLKGIVTSLHSNFSETDTDSKIINSLKQSIVSELMLSEREKQKFNQVCSEIISYSFSEQILEILIFAQSKYEGLTPLEKAFPDNVLHRTKQNALG